MRERGARSVLIRTLRLDFRTSCRCRHLIDTPPTPGVRIGADFFDRTKAGLKKSLLMRHDGIGLLFTARVAPVLVAMRRIKMGKTWRGEHSPQLLKPQFISGADIGCNCAKFKVG
jgi:hypothetical protein